MHILATFLPLLFVSAASSHNYGGYGGGGGGGGYQSSGYSDCGGSCGGGCGGYGNPCQRPAPAPVIVEQSGCYSGACSSGAYSSGSSSSSGYHKKVTTVVKEERNDELKIVVNKPTVHKTSYVQAAPRPVVYHKPQPYVEDSYGGGDYAASGCAGPCGGGGSKIVKIIKKTTYADGCDTCDAQNYRDVEYHQPAVVQPTVVHHKVTRIVTQPKVVKVVKIVDQGYGSGGYGSGGHHGGRGYYKQSRGYGGSGGGASASAYASASAGAGAGSLGYSSGGDVGGGCQSGCEEWKKK